MNEEPKPILSALVEAQAAGQTDGPSAEAQIAASWWGDRLRAPAKLDHLGPEGDTSEDGMGIKTIMIATLAQGRERENAGLSEESIAAFEAALATQIDAELEELKLSRPYPGAKVFVGVDYHPDHYLQAAADAAGIRVGMTLFPWKTSMAIEPGHVQVREGYRAEPVDLYTGPDYTPPLEF